MNTVYIGFDKRERKAYQVAENSIRRHASAPVEIKSVKLTKLEKNGLMTRPVAQKDGRLWCPISQAPMATEFAISRFAVPFLQKTGWCLFVDCDVLCWEDIGNLFALADPKYAVMCVKHPINPKAWKLGADVWLDAGYGKTYYLSDDGACWRTPTDATPEMLSKYPELTSSEALDVYTKFQSDLQRYQGRPDWPSISTNLGVKMDGQPQTFYARKNWSSVVLWNCDHEANKRFTLEMLNTLPGRDLHAFCWLKDEEIGELPQKWNWLINVTPGTPEQFGIWHYTCGGPWLKDWKGADYDEEWSKEYAMLKNI